MASSLPSFTFQANILCASVTIALINVLIYRLFLHPLAKYPGPLLAKLTGWYSVYHAYVGDLHLDMLSCHEQYGSIVRYGPNKLIFNTSTSVQDIYSRSANVQKSTAYRAFETSATAHDLQSTVDKTIHARKRRVISQAFSDSALRSLEHHILQHAETFVRVLPQESESKVSGDNDIASWSAGKNIAHWCNFVSFDYMTELVFGKGFGMLNLADERYIIDLIQHAAFRVGVCLQMPRLALWNIDKVAAPKIRSLRNKYIEKSKNMAVERMKMDSKRKDLFHYILNARDPETGRGFSMDEIWGESTLLIIAGSDAISTGMAACFFYLSRHRDVYEKLCCEIRATFASAVEIRSGSLLNSCSYLRACIKESLRMSPPVGGALWREVCASGGTRIDGQLIPKGYDVGVGIYAIHHNPLYFPNPYNFQPERWIVNEKDKKTEKEIAKAHGAFSAFSIGPVGCVGKNLAYVELSLTIARVIWSLDFKLVENTSMSKKAQEGYLRLYKDHADKEYHLRDRFTSWKDGPTLSFRSFDNPKEREKIPD